MLSHSQCSSYIWKLCLGGVLELSIQNGLIWAVIWVVRWPVSHLTTEMVLFAFLPLVFYVWLRPTFPSFFFPSHFDHFFKRSEIESYPRPVHNIKMGNIIFRFFRVLDYATVPSETLLLLLIVFYSIYNIFNNNWYFCYFYYFYHCIFSVCVVDKVKWSNFSYLCLTPLVSSISSRIWPLIFN